MTSELWLNRPMILFILVEIVVFSILILVEIVVFSILILIGASFKKTRNDMATEFQLINQVIQNAIVQAKAYTVNASESQRYIPDENELDEAWELNMPEDMPVILLGLYKTVIRECIDAYNAFSEEIEDEED